MKLNLGCGKRKLEGYLNIDIQESVDPDLCHDILNGLPLEDNSVEEVRAFDFLEHMPLGRQVDVINDIWRVLKNDGLFEHLTPSTDGRGAFCDPTHLSFWNILSWRYYTDDAHRELYNIKAKFIIEVLGDTITEDSIIHTYGKMRAVK